MNLKTHVVNPAKNNAITFFDRFSNKVEGKNTIQKENKNITLNTGLKNEPQSF